MAQPARKCLTGRHLGATILHMRLTREYWGRGRNTRVIAGAIIALAAAAVILLASF
jgi:hypothetical protein